MSYVFGPTETGENAKALLLILRKGGVHKDRFQIDQQVCVWRHNMYQLCSVFNTAMAVIWTLNQRPNVHFNYPNKLTYADWWKIPLIEWEHYSDTANATKEIYKATGVTASKLTHHRTTALQTLGFYDLASPTT